MTSQMLEGKNIVITGVLTPESIAFSVARLALEHGAQVVLTGVGRGLRLTRRAAKRLPGTPDVLEFDVTQVSHVEQLRNELAGRWGRVHGALHAIGFAPEECLGDDPFVADWEQVATALHISAFSIRTLADAVVPLMPDGGSIVGLDFDASVAWPSYGWMGVAKAALESASRYLARALGPRGVRVNLVSAGPLRTLAAKSIPGFERFGEVWGARAPLGWKTDDAEPVAKACVALLGDWFPATTGEIIHVDGGFHAVGA